MKTKQAIMASAAWGPIRLPLTKSVIRLMFYGWPEGGGYAPKCLDRSAFRLKTNNFPISLRLL